MKKLRVPAAQDIVRIIGSSDAETEQRLYAYYTDPSGGYFSYRPAHTLCRFAFGRTLPLEQILAGCHRVRNKQGLRSNVEVLSLLWNLSKERSVRTYELRPQKLHLRRDLSIRVSPPFLFVENDKGSLFWLQPRKGHAHSLSELGLLAAIVRATYLVGDLRDVGFEVCDLSAPLGKLRNPRTYTLESLRVPSEPEVQENLQCFARAYDNLTARGVEAKKRKPKQPPAGPDLLDPA